MLCVPLQSPKADSQSNIEACSILFWKVLPAGSFNGLCYIITETITKGRKKLNRAEILFKLRILPKITLGLKF